MPDLSKAAPPLLHLKPRAFALGTSLLLALALGLAAVQIASLVDGINPDKSLVLQCVPGLAAGAVFVIRMGLARRRGELIVFHDHITGRRPSGLAFDIAHGDIARVELRPRALAIHGHEARLLLLMRLDAPADGGIVWLLHEYHTWPAAIWNAYAQAATAPSATRHFLDEHGEPVMGDMGTLHTLGQENWYFPAAQTMNLRALGGQQMQLNQRNSSGEEMLLRFEPSPELLPIGRLAQAIIHSGLPATDIHAFLAELAENHGGNTLSLIEGEVEWEGECLGFRVNVFSNEPAH